MVSNKKVLLLKTLATEKALGKLMIFPIIWFFSYVLFGLFSIILRLISHDNLRIPYWISNIIFVIVLVILFITTTRLLVKYGHFFYNHKKYIPNIFKLVFNTYIVLFFICAFLFLGIILLKFFY